MDLIEGVEEFVKKLYEVGYQLAVAPGGHTKESMEEMLKTFNLLKYFPVIVSSDEVVRGKPKPDVFLFAAEKLGRKPLEWLVLEDSVNGVLAGKAAGMRVVAYRTPFNEQHDLSPADSVITDLLALTSQL